MLVPTPRLILLVLALGLPAATVGALRPEGQIFAWALIAVVVFLAMVDALWRDRAIGALRVELPELVRGHRDHAETFEMRLTGAPGRRVRLGIAWPDGLSSDVEEWDLQLPAAPEATYPVTFLPTRRGRYPLDRVYCEAASPLGLWHVRDTCPVRCEIRIYPNLRDADSLAALRRGAPGRQVLRQVGQGREFEKLRDYLPGDGFDEIHWKATSRRGKPITKVFQIERTQEIYAVIDASRLTGRPAGAETTLERYLNAALILGAVAERRGDLFGLIAFSDQVHGFVRARNGKAHYSACRDAIYQLHPRAVTPDFDELASFLRLRLRRRALLLFLTELDDPVLAEQFARAMRVLAPQHLLVVGMLRPPGVEPVFTHTAGSDEEVYQRLGAHLAWRGIKQLEASLRQQGVRFALFTPEMIAQQLVMLYGEIKQRQLL
jgi:uncharacterized protein (DUF58 family)